MLFDNDDLDALALMAWREARGEGSQGMLAVMHVAVNRARDWQGGQPGSIFAVIYAKNQFTSMSVPSDPQYNLGPQPGDLDAAFARRSAPAVASGRDEDLTHGAHYYANLETGHSAWFESAIIGNPKDHPETVKIRHHTFFV
jgi:spore germination cell wall hydrolase CwlJ-like protein